MNKAFSYFPISIAFIIAFGAVFYILTAENIGFFGGGRPVPQKVLPVRLGEDIEEKIAKETEESVVQVTTPTPAPQIQPTKEVQPPPIQKPEPSPIIESGPKTHIVSIEASGFNPRIVVINAGDTVKWVNNDTNLHWPASDPHPTHTGLAGFDPLADLLRGESFSHTFNTPRIYGYHDHTQAVIAGIATLTGIVRVLEK